MKVTVLGTGMVGRALAGRLAELGHDVVVGTRDVEQTLARGESDAMGNPPYAEWQKGNSTVRLVAFPAAGAHGEVVVNATAGGGSLAALEAVGPDNLVGKVLLDVSNPLDFSQGIPPRLFVSNTTSLAEEIQKALPATRVVKTLNTMHAPVMVDPGLVPGPHEVFVSGDDEGAKAQVIELLRRFGWQAPIDLGGLDSARGTEQWLALWFRLYGRLGTGVFNLRLVRP